MKLFLKLFLAFLIFSTTISASQYVIISNKNMKPLSKAQIKAIFLKKITIIDDKQIVPIALGARDPLRVKFEKNILKMSFARLKSYWIKQHYLGHRPPISMKSQDSIKAFVKKVDGAIGYIEEKNLDDSVKVLLKWKE